MTFVEEAPQRELRQSRSIPTTAAPQTLKDRILGEFPPDVSAALVEYATAISEIEADFLISMARKALRLHDLLMMAGCRPSKRVILSSHVLDQDLSIFKGKHVALIDDTLILGTTLGHAKLRLEEAGAAEVSTYVFAIDRDNWCRELAQPDKSFLTLEHSAMLTFCANEVEALAASGVPYLADFPMSKLVKFTRSRLDLLHALQTWTAYPLTSDRQRGVGTLAFSLLPTIETRAALEDDLGPFFGLIDIVKVRAYAQSNDDAYWFRFVPVLTLKPIRVQHLDRLWAALVQHAGFGERESALLTHHLKDPKARLRFVQYYASLLLGRVFSRSLRQAVGLPRELAFDSVEATRLFGPWLRPVIKVMHEGGAKLGPVRGIAAGAVPEEVDLVSRSELQAVLNSSAEAAPLGLARNLFTDLTRAFMSLHRDHELPAREEAHRLGRRIFTADPAEAPHRDRLQYGYAWSTLVDCMLRNEGVSVTPGRAARLSLLLDVLIDIGIAVPVLCERDGVLFRAYRHGEDVAFTEQEAALAHDVFSGFLEGAETSVIPRLICEKLLVSLLRVGTAKGLLKVVHGIGGGERVARIGFHLHGAVPFIPFDDTIFAEDHDSWFSTYLTQDGVVTRSKGAGYALGDRPEAALILSSAPSEARQLGWLIGHLTSARGEDQKAVLNESGLILLTSCPQPKDAVSAVVAELRIFLKWYAKTHRLLRPVETRPGARRAGPPDAADWTSQRSLRKASQAFVSGLGYVALHSARLKTTGHRTAQPQAVYQRCAEHLKTLKPMGSFLESHWRGAWGPLVEIVNTDQLERFGELMDELELELFYLALGAFTIELALLSGEAALSNGSMKAKYGRACAKVLSFVTELRPRVSPDEQGERLYARLCDVTTNVKYMDDPIAACRFAMRFIEGRRPMAAPLIRRAKDRVAEYGRIDPAIYYSLSLWYDVIDSRGGKSGLSGDALREYRMRVRNFKQRVSTELEGLILEAAQHEAPIYAWQGPLTSSDDEKTLFFAGRRAMVWMQRASEVLVRTAHHHGVRLRVLMINGDFAGVRPHKFSRDVHVEGEGYWESAAALKEKLKALEREEEGLTEGRSVVWAAMEVVGHLDAFRHFHWRGAKLTRTLSPVDIENYPLEVTVCGGALA